MESVSAFQIPRRFEALRCVETFEVFGVVERLRRLRLLSRVEAVGAF